VAVRHSGRQLRRRRALVVVVLLELSQLAVLRNGQGAATDG